MPKTIILGAGLVGSLLATVMAKAGYGIEVFDRMEDPRRVPLNFKRSINLTLCKRGLDVLDSVGVGDAVRTVSVPVYGRLIHGRQGELAFQPYGNRQEAIYSIARRDLNRVLLDYAERNFNIDFRFNQRCVGVDLNTPSVELKNASSGVLSYHRADKIFGCDGVHSAVRAQMQRSLRLNFSQQYWEQGYKELAVPPSNEGWKANKNVIHIWPRGSYMLIGFPNVDQSFTCSLHLPFEGPLSFSSIRTEQDLLRLFADTFPDVLDCMPDLVKDFFNNPVNSMVTIKCSPWSHEGKVAILGDAAHSIYPSYGQGANAGFEDCATLEQCLKEAGNDFMAGLKEFERRRKPNTDAIADLCVDHFLELRDMVGNPEFLLRKRIERKFNQIYPEHYQDLYSMVTFTGMPYIEALRINREQRMIVDGLMRLERIEHELDSPEVAQLMENLMAGARSAAPCNGVPRNEIILGPPSEALLPNSR